MRTLLTTLLLGLFAACGASDHNSERTILCNHIEGNGYGECFGGDDFRPLTCESAFAQFESWWRDDAQTAVNVCIENYACYPKAEHLAGPSISEPLTTCMNDVLYSVLKPTKAETIAVSNLCAKFDSCDDLGKYTITECEEVLLNPYGEGDLFLFMDDTTAGRINGCRDYGCSYYWSCVNGVFKSAGAYSSVRDVKMRLPSLLFQNRALY